MIAFAVVALGCSSARKDGAPDVVPGAPAGDVTELSGDVHATCDGKTRALAKGDTVAGDDTITTGADGRVTIVLRKNHVPWSLGPGLSKQVSESAAWRAAAPAAGEVATDDRSAAAGRHAERSATDTGASAPETEVAPTAPTTITATKGTGEGGGGTGEGTIGLGNIGTLGHGAGGTGQGYGAGHGTLGGGHASAAPKISVVAKVQGGLSQQIVLRIARQNLGRVRLCYERALANDPAAQGTVTVKLAIDKDGSVKTEAPAASTVSDDLASCIARSADGLSFPGGDSIAIATLQYTLAPAD